MLVHINATDEAGVVSSQPACAIFDAEIEWLPMIPGFTVTGVVPNGFYEIFLEDKMSARSVHNRF